ncbi:hypothetical protein YC2023_023534 [Brassica napus]
MSTSSGSQLFKCAHVELIAAYESDEAVFGGFDGKMTKLTNIRATEVGHLLVSVENLEDSQLSLYIADLVGKSYMFQLMLSHFNFTSTHQTSDIIISSFQTLEI